MASITDPGIIGYGSVVEVSSDSGVTWTAIGLVANITPPNESTDQVEVTHMQSPNRTKQRIAGLRDPGTMSLDINYVPGNDTDTYILDWRATADTRTVRITYPTNVKDSFAAFVLGFKPTLQTDAKASATLDLQVAGDVTRS